MPPKAKKKKDGASKKNVQKKKEKQIEDKTFGLKNKNKSKKVQGFVNSVEKTVMHGGDPKQRKAEEERKMKKAAQKMRKKALKDEQDALFGEALLAVSKKTTNKKDGKVEAQGRDGNDDNKKGGTSRAMKMMFQMDAQEMEDKLKEDPNYVPTLEDEIESQRQKMFETLKKAGKKGTPVTEQTLKIWLENKQNVRMAAAKKKVESEMRKKKGGKGLAVLSGRELYDYNRALFSKEIEEKEQLNIETVVELQELDAVTNKVESDLFLNGDDDDLDDLDDLDDIEDDED